MKVRYRRLKMDKLQERDIEYRFTPNAYNLLVGIDKPLSNQIPRARNRMSDARSTGTAYEGADKGVMLSYSMST